MTDTTTTAQAAKTVAVEVGKIAVKAAAETAVEVVAATALLVAFGFAAQKVQERRARKAQPVQAV